MMFESIALHWAGHHQLDWQVKETKENQEVGRPTLAGRLG